MNDKALKMIITALVFVAFAGFCCLMLLCESFAMVVLFIVLFVVFIAFAKGIYDVVDIIIDDWEWRKEYENLEE